MLPETVVLHVVPEQLEGLLLFPALQERRGGEEGEGRGKEEGRGEEGEERRERWLQERRGDGREEGGGVREGRRHNRIPR